MRRSGNNGCASLVHLHALKKSILKIAMPLTSGLLSIICTLFVNHIIFNLNAENGVKKDKRNIKLLINH